MALVFVTASAADPPSGIAKVDAELFKITCERGEHVRSRYPVENPKPTILGCGRLPSGKLVQVSAGREERRSRRYQRTYGWGQCLWFYASYRPGIGSEICRLLRERRAGRLRPVPFPVRPRPGLSVDSLEGGIESWDPGSTHFGFPARVSGLASRRIKQVTVRYALHDGSRAQARAVMIHVGRALARAIGAPRPFGYYLAEPSVDADFCESLSVTGTDERGHRLARARTSHPRSRSLVFVGSGPCRQRSARSQLWPGSAIGRLLRTPGFFLGESFLEGEPEDGEYVEWEGVVAKRPTGWLGPGFRLETPDFPGFVYLWGDPEVGFWKGLRVRVGGIFEERSLWVESGLRVQWIEPLSIPLAARG